MRGAYPIVLTQTGEGFVVYIPDFDIGTQGESVSDAMEMARDAIGIVGIDMEDDGKALPVPSSMDHVKKAEGDIVTLVDVDFTEYRRRNDMRTVRCNVSMPSWLNVRAREAGINFSQVLQEGLKQRLGV